MTLTPEERQKIYEEEKARLWTRPPHLFLITDSGVGP